MPPKTFDLLVLLVQSPGRAFSKQELMNALWPDTFVEEANLSFQISALRKALGDEGARWVETVPTHGYRFSAEVKTITPAPPMPPENGSVPRSVQARSLRTGWRWLTATAALVAIGLAVYLKVGQTDRSSGSGEPSVNAVPLTSYEGMVQRIEIEGRFRRSAR